MVFEAARSFINKIKLGGGGGNAEFSGSMPEEDIQTLQYTLDTYCTLDEIKSLFLFVGEEIENVPSAQRENKKALAQQLIDLCKRRDGKLLELAEYVKKIMEKKSEDGFPEPVEPGPEFNRMTVYDAIRDITSEVTIDEEFPEVLDHKVLVEIGNMLEKRMEKEELLEIIKYLTRNGGDRHDKFIAGLNGENSLILEAKSDVMIFLMMTAEKERSSREMLSAVQSLRKDMEQDLLKYKTR